MSLPPAFSLFSPIPLDISYFRESFKDVQDVKSLNLEPFTLTITTSKLFLLSSRLTLSAGRASRNRRLLVDGPVHIPTSP
jgi:hypothetical protein